MKLYKRENYLKKIRGFYDADDIIKVITGVRRCGKSSLMKIISEELKDKGIDDDHIIFIDLDRRGYKSIKTPEQLESVIEEKTKAKGMKYLFLDEIQNVKGFEEVVNGYRTEGNYSIFISGSNSYLLSGELTTKLTGRYLEFEILPLNFYEYEEMKRFYKKPIDPNPLQELNSYILEGGFPRTIQFDSLQDKRTYVKGIIDEIFEKDIKKRTRISKKVVFDAVRTFIINNYASTFSISSLRKALKGIGLSVDRDTLKRYITVLTDAKILYECSRFDMKSKRALSGEKKYYLSDLSFYYSQNTDNRFNYGPSLENIVYLYAKSKDYSISVGKIGDLECDFILRSPELDYSYVQVAYTIALSKETEDREFKPLEQINDNYPKYVATTDYLLQKRNGIKHINIIDFMNQNKLF